MPIRPKYQDQKITQTVIEHVRRLAKQGYTAAKIASNIGRSTISVYNIVRLNRIELGKNKKP